MKTHVPVPVRVLERLLDREKAVGGKFDRDMALTHLMFDWVTGVQRSQQDYADIWMWSKSAVNRAMRELYDEAEQLLSFRAAELIEETDAESILELFPGMPATPPKQPKRVERRLHNKPFFEKTTWQYRYAVAFVEQLKRYGISTKQYKERPQVALQDYADTFDKINRIDGHDPVLIQRVMKYLFNQDDFWISTGNLQSASQLRRKKNNDGEYVFDQLLRKMERHEAKQRPAPPDRLNRIRASYEETISILRSGGS